MFFAESITELIGKTPIVRLGKLATARNVTANILLKLESLEPCSSVKDRLAMALIEGAEKRGEIIPGQTVLVEATSGNTGIGLAMVAAAKGYELILSMPATMSIERRIVLKALGAKLVLTPGNLGAKVYSQKAQSPNLYHIKITRAPFKRQTSWLRNWKEKVTFSDSSITRITPRFTAKQLDPRSGTKQMDKLIFWWVGSVLGEPLPAVPNFSRRLNRKSKL